MTNKPFWGVQLTSIRILSRSPMKTKKHGVDSVWTFQLSTVLFYLWRSTWWLFQRNTSKTYSSMVVLWLFDICGLSVGSILSNSGKWSKAPGNASANLGTRTLNGILTCMQRCLRGSIPGVVRTCVCTLRFPFNLKGSLLFWKSGDCDL